MNATSAALIIMIRGNNSNERKNASQYSAEPRATPSSASYSWWLISLRHCRSPRKPPPIRKKPKLQPKPTRKDLLAQFNESLQELTARVSPSIVQVQVTGYRALNDKSDTESSTIGRQRSLGSGVIVDPDGYIITNAHVVKGAQRVRVVLTPSTAGDSQVRASLGLGDHSPPADARIIGIAPTLTSRC